MTIKYFMNQNNIGTRGENFAACMITQFNIFRECFLGDKFPVSDSIYEITDEITPYPFFLQVKSTEAKTGRYNKRNKYLKTPIAHEKYLKLTNRPIPTYIAGVDLEEMKVYIAPAFSNNLKYPSLQTNKIKITLSNFAKILLIIGEQLMLIFYITNIISIVIYNYGYI